MWIEDCTVSLYENGVEDETFDLIYRMNRKAETIIKIPFGDTDPFLSDNLVKQRTVLGPILNK